MNTTAATQMAISIAILTVKASPNRSVPIKIAVSGSNTPRTAVFVGPIRIYTLKHASALDCADNLRQIRDTKILIIYFHLLPKCDQSRKDSGKKPYL
jgi:hypothetical protein